MKISRLRVTKEQKGLHIFNCADYSRAKLRKPRLTLNSIRNYKMPFSSAETGWQEPRTSWRSVPRLVEIDRHYRTGWIK